MAPRFGSHLDPPNRFLRKHSEADWEHLEWDSEYQTAAAQAPITYHDDHSKSIVSENDSPDIPFRYSVNPYRGCVHGCAYCYARPTHEYLGLSAGRDFETQVFVKHNAPQLLREFLLRRDWQPEVIVFSGVTDCYQPAEREFQLTRGCLEVARDFGQPMGVITKNALVVRDLDVLQELAQRGLVQVNMSLTTLDARLARDMEPRTSVPLARLRAIEKLAAAGIPVRVMVAPIIPGLNDSEIPAVLKAAREVGATDARYQLLRLPLNVEPVFREWLERTQTLKQERVEGLIRNTRQGELNSCQFGERMRGTGELAAQIKTLFQVFYQKLGYVRLPAVDCTQFHPPTDQRGQRLLF
ncbi:MAG: PA0069 family radical SAM protein [Planctomycetaceae bacterium]|nr:PA0069 family radical SAM protein [Planctomycetaceae bacterium]